MLEGAFEWRKRKTKYLWILLVTPSSDMGKTTLIGYKTGHYFENICFCSKLDVHKSLCYIAL